MIDPSVHQRLESNWVKVRDGVAEAAVAANRQPSEVRIIGVSKYVDANITRALYELGCHDLGESRPQILWQKAESEGLDHGPRWHMIGHLQTNKVRRLLRHRPVIHSIDSSRILDCIEREADSAAGPIDVLLEINISGDENKTGLTPAGAMQILEKQASDSVRIVGLMAMAGWGTGRDEAKRQFAQARELRDDWQHKFQTELPELSMGMSGDYREAIEAGSTMVRIGSSLFEGVIER